MADDEGLDLQDAASEIGDASSDHDMRHLATLTPDERAIQNKVRWALYRHVDAIWDATHLRSKGIHPNDAGGYEGVAALRDLLDTLIANAENAQHEAGGRRRWRVREDDRRARRRQITGWH
jgi:hypothetical protein